MTKNLVYDRQLRRDKLARDNKKAVNPKYKLKIEARSLPDGYDKMTLEEKVELLRKRLPPDKRLYSK